MEIIPGLPEDLGMQCLVRVPYRYHCNLRAVCKSWNALLSCQHFYQQRQRHGQCEEGVVSLCESKETESDFDVIIYYPLAQWLERLPQIPTEFKLIYTEYHRCVFVRSTKQLVVVGIFNSRSEKDCVLIFDFLSRRWRLGADMPYSRYFFACAASPSEGHVYVGGGDVHSGYQRLEGFVYNVEENKWDFLPSPMNSDYIIADADDDDYFSIGVFLDDKFYVVHRESERAQVYDPHSGLWNNINNDGNARYIHSCVAAVKEIWWLGWSGREKGWIDVKEIDIVSNSKSRAGQFAVANNIGGFFVSTVNCTNRVEYFYFDPRGSGDRHRWFRDSSFIFSSPSVQI
ncbi:hypothetical protein SUGI_0244700 [Cryptomeria japonica]|uniref:F-box/kelch-repeat protein At2g44130-like n=1 Tax=Cryptomeria japonica TaxID=3369 RepID=UPI002408BC6B|nr:F-box/kelch-repeat protein At2g44130-like [Cryptomeria japonica]GLJ14989.1 hypothetical protein SUGI_0244700 [Cryptomeria japonica]